MLCKISVAEQIYSCTLQWYRTSYCLSEPIQLCYNCAGNEFGYWLILKHQTERVLPANRSAVCDSLEYFIKLPLWLGYG